MDNDKYECGNCYGTFTKAWSDEEAVAEYEENFPLESQTNPELMLVCDDCYKAMIDWKPPAEWDAAFGRVSNT